MVYDVLSAPTMSPAEPPVSSDARAMMMFEANKKSLAVSYALWFLLGLLGGHRFYNRRIGSAVAQLLLTIVGLLFAWVFVGYLFLIVTAIWALIDAFLIPGWVRKHNSLLAEFLGSGRLV
jgi:TM2 domain-containing membrane protein YozV